MPLSSTPIEVEQSLIDLGERLSVRRRLAGLTQRDLAERIGVGTSTIVALEAGGTGIALGTLARVMWALRVLDDMDHLVELPEQRETIGLIPKRIRARRL